MSKVRDGGEESENQSKGRDGGEKERIEVRGRDGGKKERDGRTVSSVASPSTVLCRIVIESPLLHCHRKSSIALPSIVLFYIAIDSPLPHRRIRVLPDCFRLLSKLRVFQADETPLEFPPREVIKLGAQAVVEFMADLVAKRDTKATPPK
ncbi:hypothetical protein GOBAR_DD17032 [Gossypium barbadense]|nr:hypothetical protein GOBAR_DD17032 [Gossypium barbadense]